MLSRVTSQAVVAVFLFVRLLGAQPNPNSGPGGPLLVITSSSNPFTNYYAEILRAEGLNLFAVSDISTLTMTALSEFL